MFLLERDVREQLRACPPFLLLPVYIPSREQTHKDRLLVIIPARDQKSQCKNLISLYILPDQRWGNLLVINKLKVISTLFGCVKLFSIRTASHQYDS